MPLRVGKPVPLVLVLALVGVALARPLTLSPVAAPVPGQAPVGLTIAETRAAAFAMVADHEGNQVRSLRLDPRTGLLSPVGAVPLPNGPSAVAAVPGGRFVVATTLRGHDLSSYAVDPASGTLSPVGAVPTGGEGPVNLAVSKAGFVVVANKDSDSVGVVKIDKNSGTLSPVGSVPVGDAPNDVKVSGRNVVVGHAASNDVHHYRLDRFGSLSPVDVEPVGGSPVTGVDVKGRWVAAGTFAGDVHLFRMGRRGLTPLGAHPTGGDVTDVAFAGDGTLFVTGGIPSRVTAFGPMPFEQVGTLDLGPTLTSRTLATLRGDRRTTWVVVNEFRGNRTVVVSAVAERKGR